MAATDYLQLPLRDKRGKDGFEWRSSGRAAFQSALAILAMILCTLNVWAADSLVVLPAKIKLSGQAGRQQLVVEEFRDGQYAGQIKNGVVLSSSNPNIVKIENGAVVPVADGTATVRVKAGNRTTTTQVTVEGMEKPFEWSFRNHVQPVLAKAGCSSGACHGAAAGQNGFKLSLRGYDDEGDYTTLTRGAFGRRIIPSDPPRSLMLLKPTGAVPHKGGKRIDVDSTEYRALAEWIAAGSPGPKQDDPRIVRIEILPEHVVLKPDVNQQLLVRAHFSDGHTEDVTRWAKYTSANESVAQIDELGGVKVMGNGEGAVTAWYLSRIAIATVTVPFANKVSKETFAKAKRRNFIDDQVLEKLQSLNLPPSPRCTDEEFIRRAFVDTIGTLPTAQEMRDFLGNTSPKKRDDLIESLFRRPEFIDYWTYKWSDLLLVSSSKLSTTTMWSYYNWIRSQVASNTPWDVFVRKIITAQGSTMENGAGNFYVLHEDPRLMAETTTQAFLGMSIVCAKCHNHPMEKWTNDQYYRMANLFARVRAKSGTGDGERIIFAASSGDVVQPLRGKPQAPAPLDAKPLSMDAPEDRRVYLAEWLTSPANPYFSRSIVNRVWANYMGVGLVEAVDDLRVTNPASNEKLLSALGKYLADNRFDLRVLMRTILQSEAYQRSSVPLPENTADTRFYSRYYPRRMMAEVLLDAISQVTAVPTEFFVDLRNANRGLGAKFPAGLRALQLPDSRVESYFLKSFGRASRETTCECERTSEPSITQVLHLANGDTINKKLDAKDNAIGKLIGAGTPPEKIVEEAYLNTMSRYPTATEKEQMLKALGEAKGMEARPVIEDLYWALVSSREFLFNH